MRRIDDCFSESFLTNQRGLKLAEMHQFENLCPASPLTSRDSRIPKHSMFFADAGDLRYKRASERQGSFGGAPAA